MNADSLEVARAVAKEYAEHTNQKIELYVKHTTEAIDTMSESIRLMARTVQESNKQIVRYEERQLATVSRMERIEDGLKEQGKNQRIFKDEITTKLSDVRDEVKTNSTARKMAMWIGACVVVAMISGGVLFGSITGKVQRMPTNVSNNINSNNVPQVQR